MMGAMIWGVIEAPIQATIGPMFGGRIEAMIVARIGAITRSILTL